MYESPMFVTKKAAELLNAWRFSANQELLKRALKVGFPVTAIVDPSLGTAVHVAAHQGCLQSLVLLTAKGAKDNVKNSKGRLAVHLAAVQGNDDCVHYLLKTMSSKMDARDEELQTPLMLAVQGNYLMTVKFLASRGAAVSTVKNKHGQQAIHFCQGEEMLTYLLGNTSSSIDAVDASGKTLLHLASAAGNIDLIRTLNEYSAAMNKQDNTGSNPLHVASLHRNPDAVRILIKSGCSHTAVDHAGYTPLERALLQQDLPTTNAFYEGGAIFTKRQLLFLGVLRREAEIVSALEKEGQDDHYMRTRSRALAGSLQHPNLKFPNSDAARPKFSPDDLEKELQRLKDPVARPLGTTTSETLAAVFSRMLRHSMVERRAERPAVQPRNSESVVSERRAGRTGRSATKDTVRSLTGADANKAPGADTSRKSLERLLPHYRSGLDEADGLDDDAGVSNLSQLFPGLVQRAVVPIPEDRSLNGGSRPGEATHGQAARQHTLNDVEMACFSTHSAPSEVYKSLFWAQAKVSPEASSAATSRKDSEQGSRRESIVRQWKRGSIQRRRNPWGAVQESAAEDDTRFPPRHLKSMPARRMAMEASAGGYYGATGEMDLAALHASKVDGMADFEEMMARRTALFQNASQNAD